MFARVDDQPVMVFVDRKENQEEEVIPPAPNSGLHLFHKDLGNLVMYEVTPFDRCGVMDFLYRPTFHRPSEPSPASGSRPSLCNRSSRRSLREQHISC